MNLRSRVVLITGAARGIGEAVAREAATRGARIAAIGLEPDRLAALVADLGPGHHLAECDVTDQRALEAAVAGTVERFGRIDVVVANAGIANNGTLLANGPEPLVRTVEVNLIGVIRTVSATLPQLIEHRGHLLLVSSVAAFTVMPGMAGYCASKAGVEHFGNAMRLELAHRGVTVGVAHPSWIDTDLVRDQKNELAVVAEGLRRLPPPMRRMTSVRECAVAFVDGIEKRRRRVYVPRSMAVVQALRVLTLGPIGERVMRREAARMVPRLEAEVGRLGRAFGHSSVEAGRR